MNPFQINVPIIAGKPFFEYSQHYFDVLADIQSNNKYEGYYIKDKSLVTAIDSPKWKYGTGNEITRLMFDLAVLLYVDRFCPAVPSRTDNDYLTRFVELAFIWAYSMRVKYIRVGWITAQNYILNGINVYKIISESNSPSKLLSRLEDVLEPLNKKEIKVEYSKFNELRDCFEKLKFLEEEQSDGK